MGNSISVPYSGHIPWGIIFGDDVFISGMLLTDCKEFSVSLCSGLSSDSDTALTFNPRLDDGKVVRNHKKDGRCGAEETTGGMPFSKGQNFELCMKVEKLGYKITVNGKDFCNFNHRIPIESVLYLYIEGDVVISSILNNGQAGIPGATKEAILTTKNEPTTSKKLFARAVPFDEKNVSGNIAPPPYCEIPNGSNIAVVCTSSGFSSQQSGPMFNPPVPLVTPILGGSQSGKTIYISGIPSHNPSRFTVNLACGPYDKADIGLHFDVRFHLGNFKNVVVRTHRENNHYGPEEIHQDNFPFFSGINFELKILAEPSCYKITVNDQFFTEFTHRIHPFQKANYLNVYGDVQLTQVRFQ